MQLFKAKCWTLNLKYEVCSLYLGCQPVIPWSYLRICPLRRCPLPLPEWLNGRRLGTLLWTERRGREICIISKNGSRGGGLQCWALFTGKYYLHNIDFGAFISYLNPIKEVDADHGPPSEVLSGSWTIRCSWDDCTEKRWRWSTKRNWEFWEMMARQWPRSPKGGEGEEDHDGSVNSLPLLEGELAEH